jgi:hypothetical protein
MDGAEGYAAIIAGEQGREETARLFEERAAAS